MLHSTKSRQARILAAYLRLTVAVACPPGTVWAGDWTHDGTYGAVTVVALPGGQATLARDGADQQARAITYVPLEGATTTITRAYGPSGHKAVEVENGMVRQHVYGSGLAPLLRVEGDDSLTYQVGMDTISVNATGDATVAHRIGDIKQSTVAVFDAQGQPRQQVAYGTLGQSASKQQSSSLYATAAQLSNYEGLSLVLLDQLIDNRARVYAPSTGRFLALDAAGTARAYEARGNNWITFADYDGNMHELVEAIKKDRNIVVCFGERHTKTEVIKLWLWFLTYLREEKIPFTTYVEAGLLYEYQDGKRKWNKRAVELGIENHIKVFLKRGYLRLLGDSDDAMQLDEGEEDLIRAQLVKQNPQIAEELKDYTFAFGEYSSTSWDIPRIREMAKKENSVLIILAGNRHLQEVTTDKDTFHYYQKKTGATYDIVFDKDSKTGFLQNYKVFNIVHFHRLVGIMPDEFYRTQLPMLRVKRFMKEVGVNYTIFAPRAVKNIHDPLKKLFRLTNKKNKEEEEKKEEDDALPNGNALQPAIKPVSAKHAIHSVEEEEKKEVE